MELSHDDELVDNNQNQNLKLVKHTLRNQVCDFVFFEVFIVGNSISMKCTIRTNGTFICTYTLIQNQAFCPIFQEFILTMTEKFTTLNFCA